MTKFTYTGDRPSIDVGGRHFHAGVPTEVTEEDVKAAVRNREPKGEFLEDGKPQVTASSVATPEPTAPAPKPKPRAKKKAAPKRAQPQPPQPSAHVQAQPEPRERLSLPTGPTPRSTFGEPGR